MFSVELPLGLGRLLLTPQWAGLPPLVRGLLLAALGAIPLGLLLWLSRYELRLVSRTTAWLLLGLRTTVLLLVWGLVCWQPVLERSRVEQVHGRILVVVDRSSSMDVSDPQRSPLEKLRLARALGAGSELVGSRLLEEWIDALEHEREPVWVRDSEVHEDRARGTLEAERREAFREVCRRVDALTRGEISQRILSQSGSGLLEPLAQQHTVELLGFHHQLWELNPQQAEELFRTAKGTDSERDFTDLQAPLARAVERAGVEDGELLAVILLSDGQHNTGETPVKQARELGERHLPIYAIAPGPRRPPPDVALSLLKADSVAIRDEHITVEAQVQVSGLPAQDLVLELARAGKAREVLERRTLHHNGTDGPDGKGRLYTEKLSVLMTQLGRQQLVATVRPADPKTAETRTDNNQRETVVQVTDDRVKVLLVDDEARWEYHYLAAALERDPKVRLHRVLFAPPRLESDLTAAELEAHGSPQQQMPAGPDALSSFDCILLGDVAPEHLPPTDRERLERFVSDRGGTLILVAGKRSMPQAFPPLGSNGRSDPLARLLPIETPQALTPPAGFQVARTASGRETRFLEMDADSQRSEAIWSGLPRHLWGVVGTAKPGATVLAVPAVTAGERPAAAEERKKGLIVWQPYGLGRVLYVGLDSTWRWRYRVGDLHHHRFWGGLLRWAAADRPLMAGNDLVRFGTSQPSYPAGEAVQVVARLSDAAGKIEPGMSAGARILRQEVGKREQAVAVVPLVPRAAQPRLLEGQLRGLAPGQYAVELAIPTIEDRGKGPLRSTFDVRPPETRERIDLGTHWGLLEELAAASGGKVFRADEAAEILRLLQERQSAQTRQESQPLWQWWGLLVLLLVLLSAEWLGRKLAGLP
jgi:hypothetical protein